MRGAWSDWEGYRWEGGRGRGSAVRCTGEVVELALALTFNLDARRESAVIVDVNSPRYLNKGPFDC